MTVLETGDVMAVLRVAYPQFYRNAGDLENAIALWTQMFADDPLELVIAAVKALIASDEKGFPPHIGAVKARIRLLTQAPEMTEGEAWALVRRAISNAGYYAQEEYDKLPRDVQAGIGSAEVLREWALTDEADMSVISSNFMRAYRARRQHAREIEALPADIRRFVTQMQGPAQRPALEEGGE